MAFDGVTVAALAQELNQKLNGGRVSKITQTESDELYLTVKPAGSGRPLRLVLSASASLPLVYLTEENKQGPMQAPAFCMLLRKHLQGGRILDVTQPDFERILRIRIEGLDEMGDRQTHILIIELMGKYSNIILTDSVDTVIDSIRRVSASMSSVREVLPGRHYFVPSQNKEIPLAADRLNFQQAIRGKGQPVYKALYASYCGLSPILSQEIAHRAGIDADKSAIALTDDEFDRLFRSFSDMMQHIRDGVFSPTAVYIGDTPQEYAAFALTLYDDTPGATARPCSSMSELIGSFYREKSLIDRIRQRSADLRHLLGTSLERCRKKLDLQEKQMADTEKRDRYRLFGELLQTYGWQADPKASSVTVEDYHTGTPLTIPLDPQLSAQENAVRYFDRYQKLKRTAEALSVQTEQTRLDIAHLESVEEALSIARTEADLKEIREELAASGYVRRSAGAGRGKERAEKSLPLHYRTAPFDGVIYDLYVGKNNLQNDRLTFRFAAGGDWWFHAKQMPGSHVILRTEGRTEQEIPDHVFELAASLAAFYSKGREQTQVEVDYVRKKEVKKPNGAHPGFVVYYTNYSMAVRPDISELEAVTE
ncbi:MAG: NFACT family protein [Lachnospiraceae bacterium]|nr:NFACT family protein [Lachnospiraceae bacterium]